MAEDKSGEWSRAFSDRRLEAPGYFYILTIEILQINLQSAFGYSSDGTWSAMCKMDERQAKVCDPWMEKIMCAIFLPVAWESAMRRGMANGDRRMDQGGMARLKREDVYLAAILPVVTELMELDPMNMDSRRHEKKTITLRSG